jgi:hypothetical protein
VSKPDNFDCEKPPAPLNEDLTMQLYGQISMFDQLTDYNDLDNDEEYSRTKAKGEDDYSDNGEDADEANLNEYRQKI